MTAAGGAVCVVLNPCSGGGRAADTEAEIRERLPAAEIRLTEAEGDGVRLAEKAVTEGFSTVVAAGGDGTVHEVLNGIYRSGGLDRVRFGVLPLGTGNDFTRSLELPEDMAGCLEQIASGDTRPIDVVRIEHSDGDKVFLNVATFGLTGRVSEKMTEELKAGWGPLSYARAAVESLPEHSSFEVELAFEDEPPFVADIVNLIAANGRHTAAGIPVAPSAELDDGWLDVLLFSCDGLPAILGLAAKVLTASHLDEEDERVTFRRARRLRMAPADSDLPVYADGEIVATGPVRFEILPRALQVLAATPRPAVDPVKG